MPGSTKKEIYIAKSMSDLNSKAELPASFKNTNAKLLVKTAEKMLKEAEHSEMIQDEERAYVLFMKYFNVVTFLKKTADYKKQKTYYDDLLGSKNLLTSIDKAEQLSSSLKKRYDELEAQAVASKLAALDGTDKAADLKPDTLKKGTDDKAKTEELPNGVEEPTKEEAVPVPLSTPGVITCKQLFDMLEDRDSQMIIMDVRSIADFQESRINYKNVINVPAEAIKPGTTVTYIEKELPLDSMSLWKQRGNIDHIILLDWNSAVDQVVIGTSLRTLKDALFKFDSTVIIKSEPLVLEGGYEQWMLQYPMKCLNPVFDKLTKPVVSSSQEGLMDFDYPDFDETFLKKPQNEAVDAAGPGSISHPLGNTIQADSTTAWPKVDRSTKPKVDRSTKKNVTQTQVTQPKTDTLYPDVKSLSGPMTSIGRSVMDTEARKLGEDVRNAESRAPSKQDESGLINQNIKSTAGSSLSDQSSEIEEALKDLDIQKKQKLAELKKLQDDFERMEKESKDRLNKMAQEEKRLSDLEEMKRKQQTDVADLMRMKRDIQKSIADEKVKVQIEQNNKELEERNRKEELKILAEEEEEKKRRQEAVNRLRLERKKKEEEQIEIDRRNNEEKALQEAHDRATEERRQQEMAAAAERARIAELAERACVAEATERARQLEEDRKAAEKAQMEDRLKQEKELAARLERERQAAFAERRRQQAEADRLEREKREQQQQEREQAEKERLEKEKRQRDEEDRKRAEEAKRLADEKLRLVNEARSKPKIVPAPNLLSGWEKKLDPRTNRYFYINHNDGTTQWDPPSIQDGQKSGVYTTKLKDEPSMPKSGLKRSSSSPNIAQMVADEVAEKRAPPSVDRANKPLRRTMPVALPAKHRDLNPVYGNVGPALTGLRNLGNTCYMNSTIQCLNNTSPLVTYLLTDLYLHDINRGEKSDSLWEVTDDFAYVVKALWSGQYRFITPRDFKSVVGRHQPMFAGYEQQDSQEFLTFLLDGLHESLNKVKTRPKIADQENDRLPDQVAAEMAWRDHKLHNESVIVELFQGQLKSTIMCLTCRKKSVTFQAFMFLSLPIPSSTRCSLQDCLHQFSAEEKMTGSSRWKCPQCNMYRDSVKNIVIWKLPPILLIALNRFVYEGQWRTKINAAVDFPAKGLDMNGFVHGPPAKTYKLYAVSNHFGTLDGGHYTACCRNPITQKWYKFDDHEVYETSESSVRTSAAYVLYYTSIDLLRPEFKPSAS